MKLIFSLLVIIFLMTAVAAHPSKEVQLMPRSFGLSSSSQYVALKKRNESVEEECEEEDIEEDELECEEVETLNEEEEDCEEIENPNEDPSPGTDGRNTTIPITNSTFINVDPTYGQLSAASHLASMGWSMLIVSFSILAIA